MSEQTTPMDRDLTHVAAHVLDALKWLLLGEGEAAHRALAMAWLRMERRYGPYDMDALR
jgi:hypothetical protein